MANPKHVTLTPSTSGDVVVTGYASEVAVINVSGEAPIYFRIDGTAPTIEGDNCYVVPAGVGATTIIDGPAGNGVTVKAISASAVKVSVAVS